jgi:uncharacterized protein YndB with AHSA1/START domain
MIGPKSEVRGPKGYVPSPDTTARIEKTDAQKWTLVITRELRHSPENVWKAITDPAQLKEWAPFDASANLGAKGVKVKLTTVGAPKLNESETVITRADAPRVLEYTWGDHPMKWELEPQGTGTKLTLWTSIPKGFIAMGAAGWHLCFDVMDAFIAGTPIGRTVGPDAMHFQPWHELHASYAAQFGIEMPKWGNT